MGEETDIALSDDSRKQSLPFTARFKRPQWKDYLQRCGWVGTKQKTITTPKNEEPSREHRGVNGGGGAPGRGCSQAESIGGMASA